MSDVSEVVSFEPTATPGTGVIAKAIYNRTAATRVMHDMPRFGHSRDFANLFASNEEQKDYIAGLLFAGIFLISIFLTFSVILLILKCFGPKRVGYLAGAPFVELPPASEQDLDAVVDEEKPKGKWKLCHKSKCCTCSPNVKRAIFCICTVILVIFSVLFVTNGLTNLRNTVVTVIDSSSNINNVTGEVDRISDQLRALAENTTNAKNEFAAAVGDDDDFCLSANNTNISTTMTGVLSRMKEMGNFTFDNMDAFQQTTNDIMALSDDIYESTENISLGDWQALVILIPYTLVPFLLLIGAILAWLKMDIPKFRCFLSYFILPIFIVLVVFAYCFASAILIAASANADFCSGGEEQVPDVTVTNILENIGFETNQLAMTVFTYYINQCVSSDPFPFMATYTDQLQLATQELSKLFEASAGAANATIQELCAEEPQEIWDLADQLRDNLQMLIRTVLEALYLLRCANIIRLYTLPVYSGSCTYSINGVTWAFAAFTVVGVAGLLMIMLRSSLQLDLPYDHATKDMGKGVMAGDMDEDREQHEQYAGDEHEVPADGETQEGAQDTNTNIDSVAADDDDWLNSEFLVPDSVHLEEENSIITTGSAAGSRKPQHFATPF